LKSAPSAADRDPQQRQFPAILALIELASRHAPDQGNPLS